MGLDVCFIRARLSFLLYFHYIPMISSCLQTSYGAPSPLFVHVLSSIPLLSLHPPVGAPSPCSPAIPLLACCALPLLSCCLLAPWLLVDVHVSDSYFHVFGIMYYTCMQAPCFATCHLI